LDPAPNNTQQGRLAELFLKLAGNIFRVKLVIAVRQINLTPWRRDDNLVTLCGDRTRMAALLVKKNVKTMEDFARAVGLSRPTVSKFFNDPSTVRAKTRAKIEAVLKTTRFRPNIFAVNLNRKRTKIIGLIIPDPTDPFYMALSRRIEMSANDAGFLALLLSSDGRPELEERAIETITALNVGGAIIAPLGIKSHRAKLKALGDQIPIVFVDSPLDDKEPFVGTDNHQSIPLITEYLCRSGEPPTYFDMPAVNYNAEERRKAYVATMERLNLEPVFANVGCSELWDFERVSYEAAGKIMRDGGFPTKTILCANDRVAFGVLAAINETGAKIGIGHGCDYRVAGHDNQPLSAYASPSLTTVSQDYDRMGKLALGLLFSKMGQADTTLGELPDERRILLNGELVFRRSA
jgi:DNA-binding LacI/PurR family transcriptional regulator